METERRLFLLVTSGMCCARYLLCCVIVPMFLMFGSKPPLFVDSIDLFYLGLELENTKVPQCDCGIHTNKLSPDFTLFEDSFNHP